MECCLVFDLPKFQVSTMITVGEVNFKRNTLLPEFNTRMRSTLLEKINSKSMAFTKNLKIGIMIDCCLVFDFIKFQVSITITVGVVNFKSNTLLPKFNTRMRSTH